MNSRWNVNVKLTKKLCWFAVGRDLRLDTIYVISMRIPCTHMQPDSNMKYDAFRDFRNVLRQHVVPYFTLDFRALIKQQWNAISSPFGGVL